PGLVELQRLLEALAFLLHADTLQIVRVSARDGIAETEYEPDARTEQRLDALWHDRVAHIFRRRLAHRPLAAIALADLPFVEDRLAPVEHAGEEGKLLLYRHVNLRMLFQQPEQRRRAALFGARNDEIGQYHMCRSLLPGRPRGPGGRQSA